MRRSLSFSAIIVLLMVSASFGQTTAADYFSRGSNGKRRAI